MKRWIGVAALCALAGCGGEAKPWDGVLVYGRGADSKKLDPFAIEDGESVNVVTQIFDTLVAFEKNGSKVEPALATSWKTSADGRVWTFSLRSGVNFHDGTPCDAAAVVFNFERLCQKSHPHRYGIEPPYGVMYEPIERVEAKSPHSVEFTLKNANGTFLTNLAMFPACISSPASIQKWKADYGQHPVGTGPFKFSSWEPNQRIVLDANTTYWDGAPASMKLIFAVVPENSARLQRLKGGEIHLMDGVGLADLDSIRSDASLKLLTGPGMNCCYLAFNLEKERWKSVGVRQAVAMALDRGELIKLGYAGVGECGPNILPPTIWGYNDKVAQYPYDPAKGKAAIAAAGMDGAEIDLYVMSNPRGYIPDPANVGSVIKRRLEAIGLKPRIQSPKWEGGLYLDELKAGKHDLAVVGWITDNGDPDNFLFTLLHSSAIPEQNHSRYRSKEYDDLVEKAQRETDMGRREELYRLAQDRLRADTPVVPLAYMPNIAGTSAKVRGYDLHPMGLVRLKNAHLEK